MSRARQVVTIAVRHGRHWSGPGFRRAARGGFVASVAALALVGGGSRADDDVVTEEVPASPQQQSVVFFEQQIDGMLGGWQGNRVPDRKGIASARMLEVDLVSRVCGLDDDQRGACVAAADLEAARATEGIDRLRRKYAGRSADFQTPEGQQEWNRFHQDFAAARAMLAPPLFGRSLLARVIVGVLDDDQRRRWDEELRERDARKWGVVVDGAMEILDRQVGLDHRQHEAIAGLLAAEPLRIDAGKFRERFGESSEILAGLAISRLPEEKVDPLLTERQREVFRMASQRGAMWKQMLEQWDIIEK